MSDTLSFYNGRWAIPNHRTGIQNVNWPKGMTSVYHWWVPPFPEPLHFCLVVHQRQFSTSLLMVFLQRQHQWNIVVPIVTHTIPLNVGDSGT